MNLLSPFFPQRSGIYSSLRDAMVDATGGQYEGFSYLGLGILMLLLMTLPWQVGKLREDAASPLDDRLASLLHIVCPVEHHLSRRLAAGRHSATRKADPASAAHVPFDRPVLLARDVRMAALAIAAPFPFMAATELCCCALPRLCNGSTHAAALGASTSTRAPEKPHIDFGRLGGRYRAAQFLAGVAAICLPQDIPRTGTRGGRPTATAGGLCRPADKHVYAARFAPDCRAEQRDRWNTASRRRRQLSVYLDKFSGFERMTKYAAASAMCRAGRRHRCVQRYSWRSRGFGSTRAYGQKMKDGGSFQTSRSTLLEKAVLRTPNNWNSFGWLLLVSLLTTVLCAPFFRIVYSMGDEGFFLRGAELMLHGKKLYADFFAFLPPGSYVLTAGWFGATGISVGFCADAGHPDHYRDCMLYLSGLSSVVQECTAFRRLGHRLGDDDAMALDANQSSLVCDVFLDGGCLGYSCEP